VPEALNLRTSKTGVSEPIFNRIPLTLRSLFFALAGTAALGFGPNAASADGAYRILKTEESPRGSFRIEHHTRKETKHEVWLVSKANGGRRLLFHPEENEADYDPEIMISPDEKWLIRNQTRGSTSIVAVIHKRKAPLVYSRAENLERLAWKYVAQYFRLPPETVPPFHRAIQGVRWLDSSSVLLVLHGDTPGAYSLGDWHCVYHVDTATFSIPKEFAKGNRAALLRR
jgi:hypothetical protein